jgi:D-lactate dehydrogenase (cytochrome)
MTPAYYMIDTTVPRSRLAETIAESNRICASAEVPVAYAFHAGDGNLHPVLLILRPGDRELVERVHRVAREIVGLAVRKQGSLTGEHGVGIEKREYMPMMYSPAELSAMLDVKNVFDPHSRFNPGKIFPSDKVSSSAAATLAPRVAPPNLGKDGAIRITFESREFAPDSVEQSAEVLAALSAAHRRARIGSGQSKEDTDFFQISTRALEGIKTYAPDDLYVTVGAGTRLVDLESFLNRDQKQMPLASPWPRATLGGLVAANVNAPLRIR